MKRLSKWFAAFFTLDRIAARQTHHGKAIQGVLEREAQRDSVNRRASDRSE